MIIHANGCVMWIYAPIRFIMKVCMHLQILSAFSFKRYIHILKNKKLHLYESCNQYNTCLATKRTSINAFIMYVINISVYF